MPATQGTKKEHKPKLLSPDIFQWGTGLPRARVGAKKFGMSKLFGWDIPGFCWDIPAVPEKFEKKMFVLNFGPLNMKFPPSFLQDFPAKSKNKTHWRASVGVQGEGIVLQRFLWTKGALKGTELR